MQSWSVQEGWVGALVSAAVAAAGARRVRSWGLPIMAPGDTLREGPFWEGQQAGRGDWVHSDFRQGGRVWLAKAYT